MLAMGTVPALASILFVIYIEHVVFQLNGI
jgi:hypothetical protein